MSEAAFIEVDNVVRWFDGVKAVNGVSFSLPAGQVVGLIGANGAGKTTTMRILATLDVPDRGAVRIGGIDVVDRPNEVRRRLGWMPDHFAPYRDTTVIDYLDFFGRAHGLRGAALGKGVREVAEFTDLTSLLDRSMDKLSKGQTQRLCLARTLLNDPEFLILDEPAAGLDPKARLEFKNLVRVLRERGKTILISSHILSELGEMCDTLVFMDRGVVMHHGDTDSILRSTASTGGCSIDITVDGPTARA
jgi:ABC-2 type transport system ATP-binding protein